MKNQALLWFSFLTGIWQDVKLLVTIKYDTENDRLKYTNYINGNKIQGNFAIMIFNQLFYWYLIKLL